MKIKNLFYLSLCILISLNQMSCDVINPEEEIPSYLHIESFEVEENVLVEEGSLQSKIVAAQVLVNNVGVGIIPIPSTVAVLASGDVEIILDPLVQENGSNELLNIYPFYNRVSLNTSLTIGETSTINPKTTYVGDATIVSANFNGADPFFVEDLDGNPETNVEIEQNGGQAGEGGIGKIVLTEENPTFTAATNANTLFDLDGQSRIWLEVQYKTESPMLFGLIDRTTSNPTRFDEYGINVKDEWNILYFNLLDLVNSQQIDLCQLSLWALFDNESGIEEQEILLDNIKLISL